MIQCVDMGRKMCCFYCLLFPHLSYWRMVWLSAISMLVLSSFMQEQLENYKENHLLFLHDFAILFSNNMPEKDLRICKNCQKMDSVK